MSPIPSYERDIRYDRVEGRPPNLLAHGDRVDCHWPALGLTVELLSCSFHGSRAAFEADVGRRRHSGRVAFTYGDVFERPAMTIAELRGAINAR